MIKTLFLFGALLALPLRAATLPLSAETQAYADTLTGLTFCYPALQRPPYLEAVSYAHLTLPTILLV